MKYCLYSIILLLTASNFCLAQKQRNHKSINRTKVDKILRDNHRQNIRIPQVDGYTILKGDFHIHTIFSDGLVWPTVRVEEAWKNGLDIIAITDHIEGNPYRSFIDGDNNSSYEIAKKKADELNILLARGGEITRAMPAGHMNAIFLKDVNKLNVEKQEDAVKEANKQGAFVMWNHPGWDGQQPDTTKWFPIQEKLYKAGLLHGVEVFTWDEYYPIAMDWVHNKNMSYIANSDIHDVDEYRFNRELFPIRAMTLVFAKERSLESACQAMHAHKTVAFFANRMAGPEELMKALFKGSIEIKPAFRNEKGFNYYELINYSDIVYDLQNCMVCSDVKLFGQSTAIIKVKSDLGSSLAFDVVNCNITSGRVMKVKIELPDSQTKVAKN